MTIALGIDTGGTYTDAALVNHDTGQILCTAKALTTRRDLSIGIGQVIEAVFQQPDAPAPQEVDLAALSTTLATNAIVEGQGSPVCLILLGYDADLIEQYNFQQELVTDDVVYIAGGHSIHGDEAARLDEAELRAAVLARRDQVEAFAVSGYFSVRNPEHELRAKDLIEKLTGLPVTCGHDLTSRLNSVRRATTAALNARLVPLLQELIETLRRMLATHAIAAPLMVVKGDGSLVQAEWAMQRPIETILSGPAASAVGAWHLAGQDGTSLQGDGLWAVDIGGTTTDIAVLRNGRPRLNPEGAQVGRWRTMIEAVDVHTIGLGGDSRVHLSGDRCLVIGPQRVVPLSLLASHYPEVLDELQGQTTVPPRFDVATQFLLPRRQPTRQLDDAERSLLARLSQGPASLSSLIRTSSYGGMILRRVDALVADRLVLRAGFTPTDALHALGRLDLWDARAAELGARILAKQAGRSSKGFCEAVVRQVSDQAATALVTKALSDEAHTPHWQEEPTAALLLSRALDGNLTSDLDIAFTLRQPVVAIGAPVEAYMPRVTERLHTHLTIPQHAEVANAVGAVAGGVVQRRTVTITPLEGGDSLRLHLPLGVHDFADVEAAVAFAQKKMEPWMADQARQAGATQVEVRMARHDRAALVKAGWGDRIYLGTELIFTATGRPSPAVRAE